MRSWVGIKEVAVLLNEAEPTVRSWVQRGALPASRVNPAVMVRSPYRIHHADLYTFAQTQLGFKPDDMTDLERRTRMVLAHPVRRRNRFSGRGSAGQS